LNDIQEGVFIRNADLLIGAKRLTLLHRPGPEMNLPSPKKSDKGLAHSAALEWREMVFFRLSFYAQG